MLNKPNDARLTPRYKVELRAHISFHGQTILGTTKDISRGGICLICSKPIAAGSPLEIDLVLELAAEAFSEHLILTTNVIWCTTVGQLYQIGCSFEALSPGHKNRVEMFLRFLDQEVQLGSHEPAPAFTNTFDTGDAEEAELL